MCLCVGEGHIAPGNRTWPILVRLAVVPVIVSHSPRQLARTGSTRAARSRRARSERSKAVSHHRLNGFGRGVNDRHSSRELRVP